MKRIRELFCKADPIGIAIWTVLGSLLAAEMIHFGWKFFIILLAFLVFAAMCFGVGCIIYKVVVFAQRRLCK